MEADLPLPLPPRSKARDTSADGEEAARNSSSLLFFPESHRLNGERLGGTPSSDPPLFSSDDFQSAALENYYCPSRTDDYGAQREEGSRGAQQPLRKRRYRGTWWGEHVRAKKRTRRRTEFKDKRNFDSGVWLESEEGSTDQLISSEDALLLAETKDNCLAHGTKVDGTSNNNNNRDFSRDYYPASLPGPSVNDCRSARVDKQEESEPHRRARSVIMRCLEDGNDNVDLTYFNMETIPPGLLRPLVQLTKEPAIGEPPLADDLYGPLEPFLRLFLTRNLLSFVPAEVMYLERLRVLSLRHNKITEIPSSIRNLTKLVDLNVAANRLGHLPWEVLCLMQTYDLRQLTVHPNPFIKLDEEDIEQWHCQVEQEGDGPPVDVTRRLKAVKYHDEIPPGAWTPAHVATSKVQYLDMEGRPFISNNKQRPSSNGYWPNVATSSLRELSLRACTRSTHLTSFFDPEDSEDLACFPDPVFRLLSEAKRVKDAGGQLCSICSTSFVLPRTEWVEWWDCIPFENGSKSARKSGQDLYPLPFLRKGCSWACCPEFLGKEASV